MVEYFQASGIESATCAIVSIREILASKQYRKCNFIPIFCAELYGIKIQNQRKN